jgi:hypothetical protein
MVRIGVEVGRVRVGHTTILTLLGGLVYPHSKSVRLLALILAGGVVLYP